MKRVLTKTLAVASCVALAVSTGACAESKRGGGEGGGTLTVAGVGKPNNFDPFFNTDGESFRPARQIFETLITHKEGSAELAPGLAEKWEVSADGKEITFNLRDGVKFHDGTDFNAEAVCFNFERWFNIPGAAAQSQAEYYADVFDGFAKNEGGATGEPVYKSCEATDGTTAVVKLNKAKGAFPAAFALTSLSIGSPTAMKKYDADKVTQTGDSFSYNEYAKAHPTGTGPFKFQSYDANSGTITLTRFEDYWGEKAKVEKLIIRTIPDENTRKQELLAGTVDIADFPNPQDWAELKKRDIKVEIRPAFNILYLGINQKNNPKLKDLRVRQAIAHAVNRAQLVKTKLPEGAEVAIQFMPDTVEGYAEDVKTYDYNPQKAKDLLNQAGAQNLTVKFYYPTEVTRPYMPDPKGIFTAIAADLKAVGITVQPVAKPWTGGYLDDITDLGKHDMHLLGWTGDYNDAGNFIGTFFGRAKPDFGFNNPALFNQLSAAAAEPDAEKRKALYQEAMRAIMEYLPAVPISHSPPAIAVGPNVEGLKPSPLTSERFDTVSKK
ncbi:MAG TPA: ABC transporter substrate-binding protein [Cryptosporangiaceae bacterium]|nr:ABC transporter substrate-binding protein [Cryptosporangiaceae bacterium]